MRSLSGIILGLICFVSAWSFANPYQGRESVLTHKAWIEGFGEVSYRPPLSQNSGHRILLLQAVFGGTTHRHMSELREQFDRMGYQVYTLDLPGTGESDSPKVLYNMDLIDQFLRQFVQRYIQGPTWIVGEQVLGLSALEVSKTESLIVGITLVQPVGVRYLNGPAGDGLKKIYEDAYANEQNATDLYLRFVSRGSAEYYLKRAYLDPKQVTEERIQEIVMTADFLDQKWATACFIGGQIYRAFSEAAKDVHVPVQVIFGESPRTPGSIGEPEVMSDFQVVAPQFRYDMIPESANLPHREHPTLVAAMVDRFINDPDKYLPPTVDSHVWRELGTKGVADILVVLRPNFDFRPSQLITDLEVKKNYLYKGLVEHAESTQNSLIQLLTNEKKTYQTFYIQNTVAVNLVDRRLLDKIVALKNIKAVYLNREYKLKELEPNRPTLRSNVALSKFEVPEHLQQIGAQKVWDELGVRGEGIVVAGQDNGVFWRHRALKYQYRGYQSDGSVQHNYNWHDSTTRRKSLEPADGKSSHGTHTLGTAVGYDGGGNHIGVAPASRWIACRNMDEGVGKPSTYLECFEFLFAPYPLGGDARKDGRVDLAPHIINNSWGCPDSEGCRGDEFVESIRAMKAAGIMVVASAGNDGPSCGTANSAPGFYAGELMSVGAANTSGKGLAEFSSRGPSTWNRGLVPNVVAPGESIRSAVATGVNAYDEKSGTSMAGPHVAGAVALLWSAVPSMKGDIDGTMDLLQRTATPMVTSEKCGGLKGHPDGSTGYGMIDIYKAITSVK